MNNANQQKIPDQELQRRISLYYHNLLQESLSQWFFILQTGDNAESFAYDQYLQLNLRLQKSLISDFDLESATQSAIDDWRIDLAREQEVKLLDEGGAGPAKPIKEEEHRIHFDRLRQFFFDLCVSWCQVLDIELFLFFFNGLFINISRGYHITASTLKPLEEIEILPLSFFNTILEYRKKVIAVRNIEKHYEVWYNYNFEREDETKRGVEGSLSRIFSEKEWRIYDIWLNSSDPAARKKKSYLKESLHKMNCNLNELQTVSKDIPQISKTLLQIEMNKKQGRGESLGSSPTREKERTTVRLEPSVAGKVENETAQWKIERIIIDNLPDNFHYAKLEEITSNSILLENSIRLPILGRRCKIHARRSRLAAGMTGLLSAGNPEKYDHLVEIKEEEFPVAYGAELYEAQEAAAGISIDKNQTQSSKLPRQEEGNSELKESELSEEEKREEKQEDNSLCEKILEAIEAGYFQDPKANESSPSPIRKSKKEHQRLVAKLKYQIPDEWQKPFDKNSALSEVLKMPLREEFGQVNRRNAHLWQQIERHAEPKRPFKAGDKSRPLPLSNRYLVESLVEQRDFQKEEPQRKAVAKTLVEQKTLSPEKPAEEANTKNLETQEILEKLKEYQHLITAEDIERLKELGVNLNNPLDFGLFVTELKCKFNEKYKSPYLNSIGVVLPYRSKRHEMGGIIEQGEWPGFFKKLVKLADRVKRKRKRIILNRKKKGKTLIPRKYIYKPPQRPNLKKDDLYMSVLINSISTTSTAAGETPTLPPIKKSSRSSTAQRLRPPQVIH